MVDDLAQDRLRGAVVAAVDLRVGQQDCETNRVERVVPPPGCGEVAVEEGERLVEAPGQRVGTPESVRRDRRVRSGGRVGEPLLQELDRLAMPARLEGQEPEADPCPGDG